MRLLRRPDLAGLSDDARQHLKHALHFGAGQYSRPALATLAEQFELESTPVMPRDRRSASSARMALDLRISGGVLVIAPAVEAMAASRSKATNSPRISAGACCARSEVLVR